MLTEFINIINAPEKKPLSIAYRHEKDCLAFENARKHTEILAEKTPEELQWDVLHHLPY